MAMVYNAGSVSAEVKLNVTDFKSGMKIVGGSLKRLSQNLLSVGAAFSSLYSFQDYRKALNSVSVVSKLTGKSLDDFGARVKTLDASLGTSAALLRGAYQAFSSSIQDVDKAFDVMVVSAKFAEGQLTSTAAATDIITSAMNAYGISAQKAADILATTIKTGKITGDLLTATLGRVASSFATAKVPFEELGAGIATLTTLGVTPFQAMTQLNRIIVETVKPTLAWKEALYQATGQTGEQVLATRGLAGLLEVLMEVTGGNITELNKYFNRAEAVRGVLTLLIGEGELWRKKLDDLRNATGYNEEAYRRMTKGISYLMVELNKLQVSIGEKLNPMLLSLGEVVKGINDAINGSAESTKTLGQVIRENWLASLSLAAVSVVAVGAAITSLTKIVKYSFEAFTKFGTFIKELPVNLKKVKSSINRATVATSAFLEPLKKTKIITGFTTALKAFIKVNGGLALSFATGSVYAIAAVSSIAAIYQAMKKVTNSIREQQMVWKRYSDSVQEGIESAFTPAVLWHREWARQAEKAREEAVKAINESGDDVDPLLERFRDFSITEAELNEENIALLAKRAGFLVRINSLSAKQLKNTEFMNNLQREYLYSKTSELSVNERLAENAKLREVLEKAIKDLQEKIITDGANQVNLVDRLTKYQKALNGAKEEEANLSQIVNEADHIRINENLVGLTKVRTALSGLLNLPKGTPFLEKVLGDEKFYTAISEHTNEATLAAIETYMGGTRKEAEKYFNEFYYSVRDFTGKLEDENPLFIFHKSFRETPSIVDNALKATLRAARQKVRELEVEFGALAVLGKDETGKPILEFAGGGGPDQLKQLEEARRVEQEISDVVAERDAAAKIRVIDTMKELSLLASITDKEQQRIELNADIQVAQIHQEVMLKKFIRYKQQNIDLTEEEMQAYGDLLDQIEYLQEQLKSLDKSDEKKDKDPEWFKNLKKKLGMALLYTQYFVTHFQNILNQISGIGSLVTQNALDALELEFRARNERLDEQYEKEKGLIEAEIDNEEEKNRKLRDMDCDQIATYLARQKWLKDQLGILDDQYAKDQEKADKEYLKRKNEENRKAFERDKVLKILQIGIATAQGIVNAWVSSMLFGPIAGPIFASALTTALTGLATAKIALIAGSQFVPEAAEGGFVTNSGDVRINEEGGEIRRLSSGEMIFPNDISRELAANVAEKVDREPAQVTNNFYIKSDDPEVVAEFVMEKLSSRLRLGYDY